MSEPAPEPDPFTVEAIAEWVSKRAEDLIVQLAKCPCTACLAAAASCRVIARELRSGMWRATLRPSAEVRARSKRPTLQGEEP